MQGLIEMGILQQQEAVAEAARRQQASQVGDDDLVACNYQRSRMPSDSYHDATQEHPRGRRVERVEFEIALACSHSGKRGIFLPGFHALNLP